MGDTIREEPICELALSMESHRADGGINRKDPWDIVCARRANIGIGTAEANRFLWLPVVGWDWNFISQLAFPIFSPLIDRWTEPRENPVVIEKYRYQIPPETIEGYLKGFSTARSLDTSALYQPGMIVYDDDYLFTDKMVPIDLNDGVIWDKQTESFVID